MTNVARVKEKMTDIKEDVDILTPTSALLRYGEGLRTWRLT